MGKPKMKINLIVACDANHGIGLGGQLPWSHLDYRSDMANFKALTTNHAVLMGRKTWESLPAKHRPLKQRRNYVVSQTMSLYDVTEMDESAYVYPDIDTAISGAAIDRVKELWVIGGQSLYTEFVTNRPALLNDIWVTEIEHDYKTDTTFPLDIVKTSFVAQHSLYLKAPNGVRYSITCYH